jgi:hypothetical protein
METTFDLVKCLDTICMIVFETIGNILQDLKGIYEKIVEVIETFENEGQTPNKRLSMATVKICSLDGTPPLGPRRAGRRMGGRMGVINGRAAVQARLAG